MKLTPEQNKAVDRVIKAAKISVKNREKIKSLIIQMIDQNLGKTVIDDLSVESVGSISLRVIAAVERTKELIETPPKKWERKLLSKVLDL